MNEQEIKEKLDKLYWTDIQGYTEYLNRVKVAGYKVMRNSKGIHKVENKIFGDLFGGMFR